MLFTTVISEMSLPKGLAGMRERRCVLFLLAVAVLVYLNTLANGFAFDDELYIFSNPAVTHFSLPGLFHPLKANNVFRPVTFGTLALNWAVGGARPAGYHLFNLLLHAMVTVLLYLVFRKLLEHSRHAGIIAFVAALLFAVHPIHTEAVAWVSARSELLAGMFLLGAWLAHLEDRQVLTLVCLVLAMMSKESAVVFLPLVLAGDFARGKVKPLNCYVAIGGVIALYMGLFWKIEGGRWGEKVITFIDNPLASLPPDLRIFNALRIAWKYVGLQVYPARLSCDYSYNAIFLYSSWRRLVPAALATLFVLAVWIWAYRTARREWFLAGAIYLGAFSATSNILIPTGTIMGERLAYLPSAGLCLLVGLVWIQLERRRAEFAWALLAILVCMLGVRTVIRNRDWRDNFTLFSVDVRTAVGNAKLHSNIGGAYLQRGELELAGSELRTALSIYPDLPEALEGYGLVLVRSGQTAEAQPFLERAVAMISANDLHYDHWQVNRAVLLMELGQNENALDILNQTIARAPQESHAWSNRGVVRLRSGNIAEARSDVETALRLDPENLQAQNLLKALNGSIPVSSDKPAN